MNLKVLSIPLLIVSTFFWLKTTNEEERAPGLLDAGLAECHNTTQNFAKLGNDPAFVNMHLDPDPFENFQGSGEMITYPVEGGEDANAYFIKSPKPSNEYLFVIHEWYGLNAYVKKESEKFATRFNEMNVIALDLYDGGVAETSEKARELMQGVKTERAMAIINAAKKFAGEDAQIYTVGWCFGGGWSLQAAIEMGDQAAGAVMFYGMPEQDLERLKMLKCDVLGIFAEQDNWITPEVAEKFREKMSKTDQELTLRSYDAGHGFANPSNPVFNEEAASRAYEVMYDFIMARR